MPGGYVSFDDGEGMLDATVAAMINLGVLDGIVGYHLRRAGGVVAADFNRALEGIGVRQVPFGILSVVAANPGIRQGAAGEALGIQRANMAPLVNELVERGWIERGVPGEDRRALTLSMTPAGQATLAQALAAIHDHEAALLVTLSDQERLALVALLDRIGGCHTTARTGPAAGKPARQPSKPIAGDQCV